MKLAAAILPVLFVSLTTRASLIYVPPAFNPRDARLLVVIHGCLQSAESMAIGTGWNQIADRENMAVIYPQVPMGSNPADCWSWYVPGNQRADSGQLKSVMDEIRRVKASLKIRDAGVFAAGISSGAATVAGLLACFPREFRGGALHSGPSYGLATTLAEGEKVLKEGPPETNPPPPCDTHEFTGDILVIQGSADPVVNPKNALRVISDFNGETKPTSVTEGQAGPVKYTVSDFSSARGRGRLVQVTGLGHAWSGFTENLRHAAMLGPRGVFPTTIPFFSAEGPSATNLMMEFFKAATRAPDNVRRKPEARAVKKEKSR